MDRLLSGLVVLAAGQNSSMQMISTLVTFGLIFVIMYFLIIRPQNKKQKETQKMIEAVKKGDKVVTIGGVHGVVSSVKEGVVVVKVDDDCKIEFSKSAIAAVTAKSEAIEASTDKSANEKPAEEKK
jgi:preprotein translocase subunit YajC